MMGYRQNDRMKRRDQVPSGEEKQEHKKTGQTQSKVLAVTSDKLTS
jgi:hypothetical protein